MRSEETMSDNQIFQMIGINLGSLDDLLLIKIDGYMSDSAYDYGLVDL